MEFSDYIVFADESGDHNLQQINPEYPVFVLALCAFKKSDYVEIVVPRVQSFKLRWFGHDMAVLHEREIRKDMPPFVFLRSPERKSAFLSELGSIIADAPMHVFASVIRKASLLNRYSAPHNPYHLSLLFCMERLFTFLNLKGQVNRTTHAIFEQRGGRIGGGEEDRTLELEFRRIMAGQNTLHPTPMSGMEVRIVPKTVNSIGLQLADLIARPIGLSILRPDQPNAAYEIIKRKVWIGIKVFP